MEYYWSIKRKKVQTHTITWVNVTYINKEASPQAACGFINMQCLRWVTGSRLEILGKGMWVGVDNRNGCLLGKLSFWQWKDNVLNWMVRMGIELWKSTQDSRSAHCTERWAMCGELLPDKALSQKLLTSYRVQAKPGGSGLWSQLLRRPREADKKFRANLGYRESSRSAWVIYQEPILN